MRDIAPIHPGHILADQYLADLSMSQRKLAELIDVPPRRINQIIRMALDNDYDAIFRILRSVNFAGWISVEDGVPRR